MNSSTLLLPMNEGVMKKLSLERNSIQSALFSPRKELLVVPSLLLRVSETKARNLL